jgi:hypothetical protein
MLQMPLSVKRDLSAPMESDVFVKGRECDYRPLMDHDGLIA